jgi:hypothetical protein
MEHRRPSEMERKISPRRSRLRASQGRRGPDNGIYVMLRQAEAQSDTRFRYDINSTETSCLSFLSLNFMQISDKGSQFNGSKEEYRFLGIIRFPNRLRKLPEWMPMASTNGTILNPMLCDSYHMGHAST